ncbi:NineTeen Complex (NTC) component [Borealophlyctis nickersoniae]|nr:NineTeen Complex (NTC) component [Borealophlyctis nickersoniae]
MARNEEKAQSMLYRFREAQAAELGFSKKQERRPFLASDCDNLKDAEKWRGQVIREISKKVSKIQDTGLTDYQIRDLNDEINKLIREKGHWEYRIRDLGGPNYRRMGQKLLDKEGKEVPGSRGYKYFGRAKDLPGVRELLEPQAEDIQKKTRSDMYKRVDADYYGYRDEEDGALLTYETEREKCLFARLVPLETASNKEEELVAGGDAESLDFVAHVPVPTQQEVEAWLVRRRQQELTSMYLADAAAEK